MGSDRVYLTDRQIFADGSWRLRRLVSFVQRKALDALTRLWGVESQCGVCSRPITGAPYIDVEVGLICARCADET